LNNYVNSVLTQANGILKIIMALLSPKVL